MSDYQIEFLPAELGPCPVCGASGGNCPGESEYHGAIIIEPKKKKDPRATFRVRERVYEEYMIGSKKVKKLLYAVGDSITLDEAKRLGLVPDTNKPRIDK